MWEIFISVTLFNFCGPWQCDLTNNFFQERVGYFSFHLICSEWSRSKDSQHSWHSLHCAATTFVRASLSVALGARVKMKNSHTHWKQRGKLNKRKREGFYQWGVHGLKYHYLHILHGKAQHLKNHFKDADQGSWRSFMWPVCIDFKNSVRKFLSKLNTIKTYLNKWKSELKPLSLTIRMLWLLCFTIFSTPKEERKNYWSSEALDTFQSLITVHKIDVLLAAPQLPMVS